VRLWAEDAARAARLVALLPTHRTLELEALPRPPRPRQRPPLTSMGLLLLIGSALLAFAWFGATRLEHLSPSVTSRPTVPAPAPAAAPALRPIGPPPAGAVVLPDAELAQLRAVLERFSAQFDSLRVQFDSSWNSLLEGDLSQQQFSNGLEMWLVPQWNTLERTVPAADPGTARGRLMQDLQGVIVTWQRALKAYAHGLRTHNAHEVDTALAGIGSAHAYERAAWYELHQLEWAKQHAGAVVPPPASH
jgi:hypothetical protein